MIFHMHLGYIQFKQNFNLVPLQYKWSYPLLPLEHGFIIGRCWYIGNIVLGLRDTILIL